MEQKYKEYVKKELVVFPITISQQKNKDGIWKKKPRMPNGWQKLTLDDIQNKKISNKTKGMAMVTGKVSNIIVIDIDDRMHWKKFLIDNKQKEPKTVKARSGSGGIHLYFKYDDQYKDIKSNTCCFRKDYDIDCRTTGGCIIMPPTSYFNKNTGKTSTYKWIRSIVTHDPLEFPKWMAELIRNKNKTKNTEKKTKDKTKNKAQIEEVNLGTEIIQYSDEDEFIDDMECDTEEIEELVNMLANDRRNDYKQWIDVGICIYNVTNSHGLNIWTAWSKLSPKYVTNDCEKRWKTFKNTNNALGKGSLCYWAKEDNLDKYNKFKSKRKGELIIHNKFQNTQLQIGETKTFEDRKCVTLNNNICIFTGKPHPDMEKSLYVDIYNNCMDIKCRHLECVSKTYPWPSIKLNKKERDLVNYGTINVNITNNYADNEDLIEFEKFEIFDDEKVNELVYNSLNSTDSSFAEMLHYFYEKEYNYGEDGNWYKFEDHRWNNIGHKNFYLEKQGKVKIKELYEELIKYCKEENLESNKIKEIRKIKNSIAKNKVLKDVIDMTRTEFVVNNNKKMDFVKRLDTNSDLIGFDNGIYDLKTHTFRDGKQNDMITMTVGYLYSPEKSKNYEGLVQFLEDIQPNKLERDYLLTYLSTALFGNSLELFTILTGQGRNGKSKLIELLKMTFGDYYGSVKSQLFTRSQPDASSPDPGLLNLQRKKLVISSEPEKNQKLNSGFIKFITGRDSTQLRACHQNEMIDFEPKFITLFVCNDIPDTDDLDSAFSKRLRCINFPTEFCDIPVKEHQKQINTAINENFNSWRNDLMLLLIEHYKKYQLEGKLVATKDILKWTKKYEAETDVYMRFLDECTEEKKGERIQTSSMYSLFKTWWDDNYSNKPLGRNKFLKEISRHVEIKKMRVGNIIINGIENMSLIKNDLDEI